MAIKSPSVDQQSTLRSRAVLRRIEGGCSAYCAHCDERIKFVAKQKLNQVICNVYLDGKWDRVEHFHEACYNRCRPRPYGKPVADSIAYQQATRSIDTPPTAKTSKRKRQRKS